MFGSNLDIMNTGWRDLIFKNRNHDYGAYELRQHNARHTAWALLIAIFIFVFVLTLPTIINKINGYIPKAAERVIIVDVNNLPAPKVIDEVHPPPPPPPAAAVREALRPRVTTVRFPPPVVKPDIQVREKEPPTEKELEVKDPGQKDIKGDPNAPVNIDEPKGTSTDYSVIESGLGTGTGKGTGGTGPSTSDAVFTAVEIAPAFPGGDAAFGKFLESHIKYPSLAKENNVSGRVFVQFVVEKDGSLTDIKAIRDPGSGLGDEAIRVLRISPHWRPGIQNGRAVRVQYVIPVNFTLAEQ